ncbi:MAG: amidase family protein [Actinomycetota bacterium]
MQPGGFDAATIPERHEAMRTGATSAAALTDAYLARIAALDPSIGAVLALDPTAGAQAAASDARWRAGTPGALEGIPLLIKDNIASSGLPTTAGSRALAESAPTDAPLVTRLRDAGAIILGKANLSEWANLRSSHSTSGWSAVGGQTRNPHDLERNPSGSSSGSAAGVAAALAQAAIGTETDGSILSPSAACGIVGLKPTLGTVPGEGIVPISSHQDTAGPMTRHVVDVAILQAVLAGVVVPPLRPDALVGARIGVWRQPDVDRAGSAVRRDAVAALVGAGAFTVELELDVTAIDDHELAALLAEFRAELNDYLACAPNAAVRSLGELIAFNRADDVELRYFDQDLLEQALASPSLDSADYREHRATATEAARGCIDQAVAGHRLDAIVGLANGPAWPIDYARGDVEGVSASTPAAVAGYPSITVPAGFADGLPVGLAFFAPAGADARLLQLAFGFEHATRARRAPDLARP